MNITVTHEQGRVPVTVLQVVGKTDSASADVLQQKAKEVIDAGARYLIFDIAKIPYT